MRPCLGAGSHRLEDGRRRTDPIASPKNVTENSALWIPRCRRHFRQSGWVLQRSLGLGVDQIVCHDASPLLHFALSGADVGSHQAGDEGPSHAVAAAGHEVDLQKFGRRPVPVGEGAHRNIATWRQPPPALAPAGLPWWCPAMRCGLTEEPGTVPSVKTGGSGQR